MTNVKMEELARVQTVGSGGIGVYPPVPVLEVDKVSSAGLEMAEVQKGANILPHPEAVDDGAVMQENNGVWTGGAGGGSGFPSEAVTLLTTILRNAMYTADQSDNITDLQAVLAPSDTWSITNNLANVSTSNLDAYVNKNASYSATLSAQTGYAISSVVIKMGGVDITSQVYTNNTISISSVTGDVVITASAIKDTAIKWQYQNKVRSTTSPFSTTDKTGMGITEWFSATGGEVLKIYFTNPDSVSISGTSKMFSGDSNKDPIDYASIIASEVGVLFEKTVKNNEAGVSYAQLIIPLAGANDAYVYRKTSGDIIFAGSNSPYYGMSNISEAST